MRARSSLAGFACAVVLAGAGACASPSLERAALDAELAGARAELAEADPAELEARLNGVLARTKSRREEFASERFQAAELLARLHSALSLAGPAAGAEAVRPVPASARAPRASAGSEHLVSVIYHASQALGEARWTGQAGDRELPRSIERLELELALAYARLGFRREAAEILEAYPELAASQTLVLRMGELELPPGLTTWACDTFFEIAKSKDELEAYRFAVLALEGDERFGEALPESRARALEDWIVRGASVKFVCPESGTPFLPGQRQSPVSGVPHLDYVATERP